MDTIEPTQQYQPEPLSLHGRIGRARYLAYSGALTLGVVVLGLAAALLAHFVWSGWELLTYPLMLALMVGSVIVAKRRANDLNASGWWGVAVLVPLVNLVVGTWLSVAKGKPEANDYGPPPAPNTRGVMVFAGVYVLVFLLGTVAAVAIPAYLAGTLANGGGGADSVEARF
jgi:uncharacterized membrane protein YhaH (DUF805 family)